MQDRLTKNIKNWNIIDSKKSKLDKQIPTKLSR